MGYDSSDGTSAGQKRSGMSQVSLPVTRPSGRALLVGNPGSRPQVRDTLDRLGYGSAESDDPYAAMAELCRRPLAYRAVILSLAGLYREELTIIRAIKRRYPHTEIWLAHTDGRQSLLAEAMRLGADGLLDDDGLHRVALSAAPLADQALSHGEAAEFAELPAAPAATEARMPEPIEDDPLIGEPLLSADELRALLQEQPSMPPAGDDEG